MLMRMSRYIRKRSNFSMISILSLRNLRWDKVLLYNSCLMLFLDKLKLRWSRLFEVTQVFSYGVVEIMNERKKKFKINRQRLKPYLASEIIPKGLVYPLGDLSST